MEYFLLIYKGVAESVKVIGAEEKKVFVPIVQKWMDFSIQKQMRLLSYINAACYGPNKVRCRKKVLLKIDKIFRLEKLEKLLNEVHKKELREASISLTPCGFNPAAVMRVTPGGEEFFSLLATFVCRSLGKIQNPEEGSQGRLFVSQEMNDVGLLFDEEEATEEYEKEFYKFFGENARLERYEFCVSEDEARAYFKGVNAIRDSIDASRVGSSPSEKLLEEIFNEDAEQTLEEICLGIVKALQPVTPKP